MKYTLALCTILTACGGGGIYQAPNLIPRAQAQAVSVTEVAHLHAILRPDDAGRWYIQADTDHAPIGIVPHVEQGPDFVRVFFDRDYRFAGVIQVTSDDDFGGIISGHSNLGLNAATIRVHANGKMIDPATVRQYVPAGGGNLWISVTMVNR